MKDKPLVSVVIPTYNSEKTLDKCLKSIDNQTYNNIETIIVDNISTDKTKSIASKHHVKIVEIKATRSKARNIGINLSQGDFVLCIDSDMILTENVLADCVNAFQSYDNVGGIIIPEHSIGKNFWVKVRDFERSFYAKTEIESARFFKKKLAEKVNGYEENVEFYEESTLPQKIADLGYDVTVRLNSYILHYEPDFNLSQWLKKKYYYAKSLREYSSRYKKYASRQISMVYRFSIFLTSKRFYSKPMLAFGVLVLKILEYLSGGAGIVIGKKEMHNLE